MFSGVPAPAYFWSWRKWWGERRSRRRRGHLSACTAVCCARSCEAQTNTHTTTKTMPMSKLPPKTGGGGDNDTKCGIVCVCVCAFEIIIAYYTHDERLLYAQNVNHHHRHPHAQVYSNYETHFILQFQRMTMEEKTDTRTNLMFTVYARRRWWQHVSVHISGKYMYLVVYRCSMSVWLRRLTRHTSHKYDLHYHTDTTVNCVTISLRQRIVHNIVCGLLEYACVWFVR